MKVYAPWACVCLAEFGDMCKGVITPPSHVRGFPPPRETVVGKTHRGSPSGRSPAGSHFMCSQKQTCDANPDDSVQHKVLIVAGALLHDYLVNEEMERA